MAARPSGIAILGWGSLIWEAHPAFDEMHGPWQPDGPELSLEFSRISETRLGALTLVIDAEHGTACTASYCMSTRKYVEDSITDLCCREGTMVKYIGCIQRSSNRRDCADEQLFGVLSEWLEQKVFDAVVWTNLPSNFQKKHGKPFSVAEAVTYIQGLDAAGKAKAAEYVWRAPAFVKTPLRDELESAPSFAVGQPN